MARTETGTEPRPEKVDAVRDIAGRFNDADAALLTEYRGLRVQEIADVRDALRGAGAEYKVLKNTLARIAVREVGLEDLAEMLEGPTAIAFVTGDAAAAAKALDEAAKKYPVLEIKGGVLLGRIIDASEAQRLAKLESREILLSKVAMLASSPAQQTANVLSALLRNFGSMLAQVVTKKESGELPGGSGNGAAATDEAPAAEMPAAEMPSPEEIGEPAEDAPADGVEESGETPPPAEGVDQPESETPTAEAAPADLPEAQEQAEAAPESEEAKAEEVETTSGTEEEQ
ncbi:MAG TPA: 50S ribosomal protein L10 [Actinomycetota bacterium]